jgi:hypothetical protein
MIVGLLDESAPKAWNVRFGYGAFNQYGNFVPCG